MTQSDLLEIEGFREKSSSNLISAIKSSVENINLAKLMSASNTLGEGIGEKRITQILEAYPDLLNDYKKWTKKEFLDKIKEIY